MSTARYQRLPTEGENEQEQDRPDDSDRPLRASVQAEFNRPAPAWWKRAILIMVMCGLAWLSLRLARGNPKPQVIYANRSVSVSLITSLLALYSILHPIHCLALGVELTGT